jgi:hypothetical protein
MMFKMIDDPIDGEVSVFDVGTVVGTLPTRSLTVLVRTRRAGVGRMDSNGCDLAYP